MVLEYAVRNGSYVSSKKDADETIIVVLESLSSANIMIVINVAINNMASINRAWYRRINLG